MYACVGLGVLTRGRWRGAAGARVRPLPAGAPELKRITEMMIPIGLVIVLASSSMYAACYQRYG